MVEDNNNNTKGKGDDTMSATAKPRTGAFILDSEKSSKFLSQKSNNAERAISRFKAHHPKAGIVSPYKK